MTIRGNDPLTQYQHRRKEIDSAIARVLQSGQYLHGNETTGFEGELADYLDTRAAVATSSGTSALWLALRACGIGSGDEVITCSLTAVATVAAIELAGATPVLVDVEPDSCTLDPDLLPNALTPRTRAIIPVHLYGQPADLTRIGEFASSKGLRVIEDCAQAHGARWCGRRVGGIGDAGCFSFYPTKNLGALGDAGAVVTGDLKIASTARALREFGWQADRVSVCPGGNTRMDELQAAVLRARLPFLDADNASRRVLAQQYSQSLRHTPLRVPTVRVGAEHVFHQFVVRAPKRDQLQQFLRERQILAEVHYPTPIHLQPAYRDRLRCASPMTNTEQLAGEVLSLPLHPHMSPDDVDLVARSVVGFYSGD